MAVAVPFGHSPNPKLVSEDNKAVSTLSRKRA